VTDRVTMAATVSSQPSVARDGECWRCSARVGLSPACGVCSAPQAVAGAADHFTILGLERSLVLDQAEVERRYHDASRLVHPDRHQIGEAAAARISIETSAAVNRAYRTLRDPVARGRYWLELHGESLAENNNRVPPALAALVFDVQEQLEDLRRTPADADLRGRVESVRATVAADYGGRLEALAACYDRWRAAASPEVLAELKERLSEIAYLRTLLADVDEGLER
jgi:molecular chaperone HscB